MRNLVSSIGRCVVAGAFAVIVPTAAEAAFTWNKAEVIASTTCCKIPPGQTLSPNAGALSILWSDFVAKLDQTTSGREAVAVGSFFVPVAGAGAAEAAPVRLDLRFAAAKSAGARVEIVMRVNGEAKVRTFDLGRDLDVNEVLTAVAPARGVRQYGGLHIFIYARILRTGEKESALVGIDSLDITN